MQNQNDNKKEMRNWPSLFAQKAVPFAGGAFLSKIFQAFIIGEKFSPNLKYISFWLAASTSLGAWSIIKEHNKQTASNKETPKLKR